MRSPAPHLVAVAAVLALGGCGATDPCHGKSGVCVAVHVAGNAPALDELRVAVTTAASGPLNGDSGLVMPGIALPVQFALRLPDGTAGTLDIDVAGIQGSDTVAHGTSSLQLPASGVGRVDVVLQPVSGGGPGDDGGDGGANDDGGSDSGSDGGASVTLTPDPLQLGEVPPSSTPSAMLTLRNAGPPTSLGSITLTGDTSFARTGGTCQEQQTVDTGGSCTIAITFTSGLTPRAANGHIDVTFGTGNAGADLRAHTSGWVSETLVPSTPTPTFYSVSGTSPTDVWAAGSGGSVYKRNANGQWSPIGGTTPWSTSVVAHVFTLAIGSVYVAASGMFYSSNGGATWKQVADAFASDAAVNVFGLNATTVFGGSNSGRLEIGSGSGGFVIDGSTNQPIIDDLFGAGQQVYALAGNHVFQRNGANLWTSILDESANAVLEGGFALAAGDFYVAVRLTSATCNTMCAGIFHVSSTAGTIQTPLTGTQLSGVWGSAATDLWAVGKAGNIYHSAGSDTWTPQISKTTNDLNAVWGTDNEVFAVGVAGTIVHHY